MEVGLVSVVGCKVEDTYSAHVRPKTFPSLTDRCKKFLGIKQEVVDKGISFPELVEKLAEYEKRCKPTIVTWGNMDMKVLKHNCEKAGVDFPSKDSVVIYHLSIRSFLVREIKQDCGKQLRRMET
ncbi:exonuclease domain-containing protein [Bacillus cereus]